MKRTTLAIFLFLFSISFTTLAQTTASKPPVRIAFRGGVFLSNFSIKDLPSSFEKPKGNAAVYGGLQVDIPLSQKISLAPEVLFAISGVSAYSESNPQGLFDDQLSHVFVPILFKYKAGNFGLYAGPQADFLLKAKGATGPSFYNDDITDSSYRKSSLSGVLGVEYIFKHRFGIDARYQFSLGNMRSDEGSTVFTSYGDIKMNAFQIGLFYRFGKKSKR
jgi:opacity protein-like surface antigen